MRYRYKRGRGLVLRVRMDDASLCVQRQEKQLETGQIYREVGAEEVRISSKKERITKKTTNAHIFSTCA